MLVSAATLSNSSVKHPLTHPQKRIWYIENIYPNSSLYNIGGPVRIKETVDFGLLEEAIQSFIRRHDGTRIQIIGDHGEAHQYVIPYEHKKLDFHDFSNCENPVEAFQNWVNLEASKPIRLGIDPLYYFGMFRISERDNGYLVKCHHIIADGWSNHILTDQIAQEYWKLLAGDTANIAESAPSYFDYLDSEQKYLQSDRFVKNKLFWNEKFKVLPEGLMYSTSDRTNGRRKTFELEPLLSSRIRTYANSFNISLNTFFVFIYFLYIQKTTQQNDIVIGTPVLNRSGRKEKSTFGMFTSTMPFRFRLDDRATVADTLTRIQKELMECYFHQRYPYDLLIKDLELKKLGYNNLFETCVNYYNTKLSSNMNGTSIQNVEFYNGHQLFSLQLVIKDWSESGSLTLDIDYKIDDYTEEQIEEMGLRLQIIIDQIIEDSEACLSKIGLVSAAEKTEQIVTFNATQTNYPSDKTIYQLFEEQVERTPDRVAIRFEQDQLTYIELNEKANKLARYLISRDVTKETIVGLWTHHSIETVVAILGILKAGAAYLPIDPAYPNERIRYMLEDSGTGLVLTNVDMDGDFDFTLEIVHLNDPTIYTQASSNLAVTNNRNDLVYVIYTSGSTGKPKGTMIEHQGLTNYIWWATLKYVSEDTEVFPLYTSLAFDLTVTSVFTPLISGGTILVYRDYGDEFVLHRIMRDNEATVIKLTPAHLSLLKEMDNRNSSVQRFIVGGEDLKVSLAQSITDSFDGKIEIYNEYGPTETVVGCMIHKYESEQDHRASVPIGIPADNVMIYILDPGMNPVPVGTIGEMYISGDGVARGYLNRDDLTTDRFIDNPFETDKRMYRTGDLAKRLPSGRIEYCGRVDHQVKIRGYRIELAEIEKHLLQHEAVQDAVVIDREHENQTKYLCAYMVLNLDIPIENLRKHLIDALPEYMVPSFFIEMDEIPLNVNGKVNRSRLPEPDMSGGATTEFISSRNEHEELLARALEEILQIDQIGMTNNFYHLGGDSIKAIQVASKLNSVGCTIRVKDILSNPIIENMAKFLETKVKDRTLQQQKCEGIIENTPISSWFFKQNFNSPEHYHQSVLLNLKHEIDASELEHILRTLIQHHDALRINVDAENGQLFYNNQLDDHAFIEVNVFRLSSYPAREQAERIAQLGQSFKAAMSLQNDRLIKACIFDLGHSGQKLLIAAHHLVVDGISWRILLEDLASMLTSTRNGAEASLPLKTDSMQSWARFLQNYQQEAFKEQSYWQTVVGDLATIPVDADCDEDTVATSSTLTHHFSVVETNQLLLQAHNAYGTEPKDLMIAALAGTIYDYFKLDQAVIELEGHGREELDELIDVSRTVGWFTTMYPVKLSRNSDELSGLIKSVKEQIRRIPNNGIGFGVLQHISGVFPDYGKHKLVRFNYLGDFDAVMNNSWFSYANEDSGADSSPANQMTSLLDVNALVVNRQLSLTISYSRNRFKDETVVGFLSAYVTRLQAILQHCCEKDDTEYTPSDFETIELSQDELDSLLF
ncbi:non-ribosomal peptide synthetase [Paenibacillus sp. FJAT-26967]|uniref:non-ribosomal peptide synthetase n=1 Tax=Paenibacillus sp. FJAT-26967 TaxID=1729690 RepID=UPI0008399B97|nr:non-ribosomal peptide synthetase [Paenibacillus sp. FJAT-26967]